MDTNTPSTDELDRLISLLVDAREEARSIDEELHMLHPEEYARMEELRSNAARLSTMVADLLRQGKKSYRLLGYEFKVQVPKTTVVDRGGMLEKARERGELAELLEYGVVFYEVNADQLERLPGMLKAVYTDFVAKQDATPRVTIPEKLK
jgi:hypothetical protein